MNNKREVVLIGRDGKEATRLPMPAVLGAWIYYGGAEYGFGVAHVNGDAFYYAVTGRRQSLGMGEAS